MKIVLGIGNPGREYEATRHNVGFRVVDRVGARLGAAVSRRKFRGLVGEGRATRPGRDNVVDRTTRSRTGSAGAADGAGEEEHVILVRPQTYVNRVGECARLAVDFYRVPPDSFLAVLDDVNLPLGTVRCRSGGSSGGHNGMRSLIQHLGTEEFARLRVGVGRPGRAEEGDLVGHVLGPFSREDAPIAEAAERRAAEAVLDWVLNGVEHCMNTFNCSPGLSDEDEKEQL